MNGGTHRTVGMFAAGGAAAWLARDQEPMDGLLEVLGAVGVGMLAAALPDRINPPTWPGHRASAHSWTTVTALSLGTLGTVEDAQAKCRARARRERELAALSATRSECAGHLLLAVLAQLAAGAVVGAPVGYLSHLALDATTPAGLPLV